MGQEKEVKMLRRMKGFTLIELLIVVAIIGILAALIVPNANTAIQRAKMRAAQKDITTISGVIADYVTDNGTAPTQNGPYLASSSFYTSLCPLYIKVLPLNDTWGNPYNVYCGTAVDGNYGITESSSDDFLVSAWGKDKINDGFIFVPTDPELGLFAIRDKADFNKDIVMWNGSWIRAPRTSGTGT